MQRIDPDLERALRQSRPLDRLPTLERDALMLAMKRVQLPEGEALFTQGQPGKAMYVVVDGVLSVYLDDNGEQSKFGNVPRGEFVGEMSILDPAPHSMTAIAATDCVLYKLESLDLAVLWEEHPAASVALVDAICFILSQRLRRTTKRLDTMIAASSRTASGRFVAPPQKKKRSLVQTWKRLLKRRKPGARTTK